MSPGHREKAPKRPPRDKAGDTVTILGFNPVRAALTARPQDCLTLYVSGSRRSSPRLAALLDLAEGLGLRPVPAARETLDRLGPHHQGLALVARPKGEPGLGELLASRPEPQGALVLVLDHLEDPHNFGALIRSAAAFGALGVVYPKDRSAPLNAAALAASAGAAEAIPLVRAVNTVRAVEEMKRRGFWAVAADPASGRDALAFDFPDRTALILGSEGRGLSRGLLALADMSVGLAMESPLIDSLNVSNAGAILMHAYRAGQAKKRQRP
ncbi:MAG: RNA methyltransferase [Deltaproteobacteria bacterium]|jgi:23S rRNA (guanosine2251-2'-O)-methyltransferase|nr:RNA methyltransferase [Deltaproteobacteria bacterium]